MDENDGGYEPMLFRNYFEQEKIDLKLKLTDLLEHIGKFKDVENLC
jgi:arginine/lysine/ornithine decarboxylase